MSNNNGDMPAMPQDDAIWCQRIGECPTLATGLTKREMIAMHIASGLISDPQVRTGTVAATAVKVADALLAELERTTASK